jgi:pantetheine-phosphate adenylyltransferase
MKTALYPGSFNPWHNGHEDILKKALALFDNVFVMQMYNPAKPDPKSRDFLCISKRYPESVETGMFRGTLASAVKTIKPDAIIRGLRNGYDLQYEANNQYINEDLGVSIPFVYLICDRKYTHVSSSAIRGLQEFNTKWFVTP